MFWTLIAIRFIAVIWQRRVLLCVKKLTKQKPPLNEIVPVLAGYGDAWLSNPRRNMTGSDIQPDHYTKKGLLL